MTTGSAVARETYRTLCAVESTIPIFSRDWWLDATAGEGRWDVALVEKGGKIVAAMPYVTQRILFLHLLRQPALTQNLGPWLRADEAKLSKRLANEKDHLQGLIDQLPRFDYFKQNWHHSRTNWLPFYWRGFQQTTRYTYVLPSLSDEGLLWRGLQENIRTDIKKATDRFGLRVTRDLPLDAFLLLNRMTFKRQGGRVPYSEDLVRAIDSACRARNCAQQFVAVDGEGRHHAGAYVIWDEHSAYYLLGGSDPILRQSGAVSLCLWEAIRFAAGVTRSFDFEGSMIEPVERFFRAFGAAQTPYFQLSKTPSALLRAWQGGRQFLGKS